MQRIIFATLSAIFVLVSQLVNAQPTAVDLGLSVKWASCNVGATSPSDYGDYICWGETTVKSNYSWTTYKWCQGDQMTMTKYRTESDYSGYEYNKYTDAKTVLGLEDDAAHVNLGGNWRMPTNAEWDELKQECVWTWTSQNGRNGYKVTSSKNGNFIFLPAGGIMSEAYLNDCASRGGYWSSSLEDSMPWMSMCLFFDSSEVDCWRSEDRCNGLSIRPVCTK